MLRWGSHLSLKNQYARWLALWPVSLAISHKETTATVYRRRLNQSALGVEEGVPVKGPHWFHQMLHVPFLLFISLLCIQLIYCLGTVPTTDNRSVAKTKRMPNDWFLLFLVFLKYIFSVFYLTLLHLPPIRCSCVGVCWDRTQDSCDFGIGCQTL
jgi:hypothetical protein